MPQAQIVELLTNVGIWSGALLIPLFMVILLLKQFMMIGKPN
jgi:hypothetical protein